MTVKQFHQIKISLFLSVLNALSFTAIAQEVSQTVQSQSEQTQSDQTQLEQTQADQIDALPSTSGNIPVVETLRSELNYQEQLSYQNNLRQAIEELESQGGPFDIALTEPLLSLADSLSEQNLHGEALPLYARLLHINRINQGLYHPSQFAIIDKIILGNIAVRDWNAANDSHDFKFFVAQQLYASNSEEMAEKIREQMNWKLAFIAVDPRRDKSSHLLELDELSTATLEAGLNSEELSTEQLASLHYDRSLINYYFSVSEDETNTTGKYLIGAGPVPPSELAQLDHSPGAYQRAREFEENHVFENQQVIKVVKRKEREGRTQLEEIVALFESEENLESEALSRIYLADWLLLSGQRDSALEEYQQAYDLLLEIGIDKNRINQVFDKPVTIPRPKPFFTFDELETYQAAKKSQIVSSSSKDLSLFPHIDNYYAWSDEIPGVNLPVTDDEKILGKNLDHYLLVKFDTILRGKRKATRPSLSFSSIKRGRGNADNVEIIEDNAPSTGARKDALNDMQLLMFRPRLVDGIAVSVENAVMRYNFVSNE